MNNPQLLKGVLDGCVLKVINDSEIYGYDLIKELQNQGFTEIKGGTIYPLLQKLEKNELIKGTLKPSSEGPERKYFTITKAGKVYLNEFNQQWTNLVKIVHTIMEVGVHEDE